MMPPERTESDRGVSGDLPAQRVLLESLGCQMTGQLREQWNG